MNNQFALIFNISALTLKETAKVSRDTAQKWKSGFSIPKLRTAVLIEDAHGIPPRLWVNYEKFISEEK
jgi:hypothetical protein